VPAGISFYEWFFDQKNVTPLMAIHPITNLSLVYPILYNFTLYSSKYDVV